MDGNVRQGEGWVAVEHSHDIEVIAIEPIGQAPETLIGTSRSYNAYGQGIQDSFFFLLESDCLCCTVN